MNQTSAIAALVAGLLSFLSPCVLPLVPVYLATISGVGVLEAKTSGNRFAIFLHSLNFVIGFSAVFIILGAAAGTIGHFVAANQSVVNRISGSLLIIFGLFILASRKIPWLNFEKSLGPSAGHRVGHLRAVLVGATFALTWTPCIGPILGSILTLALNSVTVWRGTYLLALYSLGLAIPFLAVGLAFDTLGGWLKRLNRYSSWITGISSLLLIGVGILILTNKLGWLYQL